MTADELIEKLRLLDPETPIMVMDTGCGCCTASDQEGTLVRWVNHLGVEGVVLMHPSDAKSLEVEEV